MYHDEVWSTRGETDNTQLVKMFVPGERTYFLCNGGGKLIWKSKFNGHTQISLPTEKLTTGVYIVTVKNNTDSKIIKLVKE